MTASERKLVHEYLRERGDVETYTEGDEPDRHLVVAPLVDVARRGFTWNAGAIEPRGGFTFDGRACRRASAAAPSAAVLRRRADERCDAPELVDAEPRRSRPSATRRGRRRACRGLARRRWSCPRSATPRAIADLGSGGGFPGLALAVALPDARVRPGRERRAQVRVPRRRGRGGGARQRRGRQRARRGVAGGLGAHDVVTARALAPLPVLVEYAAPLLEQGGSLVAWKGRRDAGRGGRRRGGRGRARARAGRRRGASSRSRAPTTATSTSTEGASDADRFPRRAGNGPQTAASASSLKVRVLRRRTNR